VPTQRLTVALDFLYDLKKENDYICLFVWLGKPRGEFERPVNLSV
jgi:hypothetical protein